MGVLGGLGSGPLKLHKGHLHIQFVQVCPLSSGLQAKAQLPLSRDSSPITPLPHPKGPSLEGLPLPKLLEASPDINLQCVVPEGSQSPPCGSLLPVVPDTTVLPPDPN